MFFCLVDKKEQENPKKFRCVILIFKSGFVFIVFLLKMSPDQIYVLNFNFVVFFFNVLNLIE